MEDDVCFEGHFGDTFSMHSVMKYNDTRDIGIIYFYNAYKIRDFQNYLYYVSRINDLLIEKADKL